MFKRINSVTLDGAGLSFKPESGREIVAPGIE